MRFVEFEPGQHLEVGPHAVFADEIVAFASAWDPQWFHVDAAVAASGPFEGLIASGWHTCGIAMRMVAQTFLEGSESYASPGLAYVKWPHPVRSGDYLKLHVDVLEARRARHRPTLGLLRWRWRLLNQQDTEVLDLEATSLFDLSRKI